MLFDTIESLTEKVIEKLQRYFLFIAEGTDYEHPFICDVSIHGNPEFSLFGDDGLDITEIWIDKDDVFFTINEIECSISEIPIEVQISILDFLIRNELSDDQII